MKNIVVLFSSMIVILLSCNAQQKKKTDMSNNENRTANHLIHETSPYLLQHAYNPVDWHAWNDETLAKAQKEQKLLIISIGYAACHWCHVMEHESFEDSTVAAKMNSNYLSIKVDREERPDIDMIYMNAAHIITGRGGWPLNAIALPDGRPIFAGTYFPKDNWLKVLDYFTELQQNDPEKLLAQAEQVTHGVRQVDVLPFVDTLDDFNQQTLDSIWANWQGKIDYVDGGRQGAPKFMMPNNWDFLLRYYTLTNNPKVLEAVTITLDKMADGGLYDHAGGGFARYSTDGIWKVPHFEKMLYDNGQLVSLYSQAYQLTKNPYYQQVVEETLRFVERELMDKSNGFYSSLDADSEGEEGKFYIWTEEELKSILQEDQDLILEYFSISKHGNWEHSNILFKSKKDDYFLRQYNLTAQELKTKIDKAKQTILTARSKRVRPGLDDKILTSWNALMLKGYVDAFRAFGDAHYKEMALANADFILEKCKRPDGGLNRNFKNGQSTINGFLDDYSLTIEALIDLYQITFEDKWLEEALALSDYVKQHFYDYASKMFFYTSDEDAALISRSKEISDNVISSSNSSMAKALFYLGQYFYKDDYIELAHQMLNNVADQIIPNGPFYANWAGLMTHFVQPPYEIAIVGSNLHDIRKGFDAYYLPHVLFLGSAKEGDLELLKNKYIKGQTTIYVCQDKACKLPVTTVKEALDLMLK
ncbi:MAG: thioredoxin domain-containing protein [Chitinophagales bacterium]